MSLRHSSQMNRLASDYLSEPEVLSRRITDLDRFDEQDEMRLDVAIWSEGFLEDDSCPEDNHHPLQGPQLAAGGGM